MSHEVRTGLGTACVAGVGAVLLTSQGEAADKGPKVPLDKLPPAVLVAAKKLSPKAVWVEATKEDDEDGVSYEVVGVIDKKKLIVVEIDPDGEVLEIDTMVETSAVPSVVMQAFRGKFPKAKIDLVFEVREPDEITSYEFHTSRPRAGSAKPKKGKGKGKAKPKLEEITVIVSVDGKSVEIEGEDD